MGHGRRMDKTVEKEDEPPKEDKDNQFQIIGKALDKYGSLLIDYWQIFGNSLLIDMVQQSGIFAYRVCEVIKNPNLGGGLLEFFAAMQVQFAILCKNVPGLKERLKEEIFKRLTLISENVKKIKEKQEQIIKEKLSKKHLKGG